MRLCLNNDIFLYENNPDEIDSMIKKINDKIANMKKHFSHLVIDGEEVYENHGEYLLERINSVDKIEVIVKSTDDLINETLNSTEYYLTNALPEIELLIEQFYSNPNEESWNNFIQLLEGLQWIVQMIQTLDRFDKKLDNWEDYLITVATLQNELSSLLEATENQDTVLIADITQYEILPILSTLKNTITVSIDQEGERSDLS